MAHPLLTIKYRVKIAHNLTKLMRSLFIKLLPYLFTVRKLRFRSVRSDILPGMAENLRIFKLLNRFRDVSYNKNSVRPDTDTGYKCYHLSSSSSGGASGISSQINNKVEIKGHR